MTTTPPPRADGKLTVALVSEVFWEADGAQRLRQRLAEAAERGADLAVLPELPLNPWRPATKDAHDDDAEPMDGPRATTQREAAQEAGIGLVGGIIHRDADTGRRASRALVIDRAGEIRATYEKLHLPEEPGFWENEPRRARHSRAKRIDVFGLPIGVQICSTTTGRRERTLRSPGCDGVHWFRAARKTTSAGRHLRSNALTAASTYEREPAVP